MEEGDEIKRKMYKAVQKVSLFSLLWSMKQMELT